jgi:uncharacterized protein (UPF0333 family)
MNRSVRFLSFVALAALSSLAYAGTEVAGTGKTLEEAMAAATANVEAAAKKAKRCVSKYPSLDTCTQLEDGTYRCKGVRANQRGSCN